MPPEPLTMRANICARFDDVDTVTLYDAVNRITHLENRQGERTTYGYDQAGRRSVKKLANGTRASFTYDAAGNLTTLANLKSDNTVISSFDYAYLCSCQPV